MRMHSFAIILLCSLLKYSLPQSYEEDLLNILRKRNLKVRPNPCRSHCSDPVNVNITYNVIQILAFSQAEETMSISGWFTIVWSDNRLEWDASKYGDLNAVSFPAQDMWLPDIGIMNVKNSKNFDFSTIAQSRISVESDGRITWLHGAILDVTCPLNVSFFPFDVQTCYLVITPWQSSDKQMLIHPYQLGSAVDNSYLPNSNVSEWEIRAVHFKRKRYRSDLNVTYQYIQISIHLRRQPLYFVVLVLIPFSMLSGLACLIFTLEDTGDRLSVALSLVLSMTMYVVIVSSNAPRSMRSLPVIGIYLLDQLGLLSLATVLAVINNKIRYFKYVPESPANKQPSGYRCPEYNNDSPIMQLQNSKHRPTYSNNTTNRKFASDYNSTKAYQNNSVRVNFHVTHTLSRHSSPSNSFSSNDLSPMYQPSLNVYKDLADRFDRIEMITYLIISFINGIFCLIVVPSYFQDVSLDPPD